MTDSNEDERDPEPQQQPSRPIPAWVLAASLPALAYVCAYAYWCGYAWIYGVPFSLVAVQPSDALVSFGAILLVAMYFNVLITLARLIGPHIPWWIRDPYKGMLPQIVLGSLVAIGLGSTLVWGVIAFFMLAFVPLIYLIPLVHQKRVKGYANKLKADSERVQKNLEGDWFGPDLYTVIEHLHPMAMPVIALAALLVVTALAAGAGRAHAQTTLLVTAENPPRVLLGVMTDRAFFRAGYNVHGPLQVVPANELPSMDATTPASQTLAALRAHNELWP